MSVRAIKNKIIVEVEKKSDELNRSAGGIILPDTANKDSFKKGIVFVVGEDVSNIKGGDVVYYGEFTGREITVNGAEYMVLTDDEVLAVL